jgi:cell division protein FtsW (lipid II flippase)
MKKNLPIFLVIFGALLFLGASVMPWSGKYLPSQQAYVDRSGYEILFGQIAMGFATLSIPLAFYKRKLVTLTGLVVVALSAAFYIKSPVEGVEGWGPLLGLHIAVFAGGLITIGGIMPRRKH